MNDTLDLRHYMAMARKWWWLLVLTTLMAAATAYLFSQQQTPVYQATATIIVGQSIQATELNSQDFITSERLARTYADMARRRPVLQSVINNLSLPDSPAALKSRVSVTPVRDTQLLEITVEAESPEEARVTADEIANQLILLSPTALENQEQDENKRLVQERIDSLQGKISAGQQRRETLEAAMSGSLSAEEVQEIQDEINKLEQLLAQWENSYTQLLIFAASEKSPNYLAIVELAQGSATPIRPKPLQNTLLGGVVGLLLGLGIVFLIEYLDDTVKAKDELGQLGLAPLGAISRLKGKDYPEKLITINDAFAPAGEAYRMIRSNIQFAAVDRSIKTIMITSATPNEGKSITAANLGVVMAQAGLKTVVVDADFRRPVQHQIFQLPSLGGLTDLLRSPEDSPQLYLRSSRIENLHVITSGAIPPNPSELLGSQRMGQVLAELAELADIIICDSPPVLLVADAAVLSNRVDGVVLVARAGKTRLGAINQAIFNLEQAEAKMLGGVLNRVSNKRSNYYYSGYNYYYSPNGRSETKEPPAPPNPTRRARLPFSK